MASVPSARAVVRSLLVTPVLLMLFGAEEASGTRPSATRSKGIETTRPLESAPDGASCWVEVPITTLPGDSQFLEALDADEETGNILAAGFYTQSVTLDTSPSALSTQHSALSTPYSPLGGTIVQNQMVQFYTGTSFELVPNPTETLTNSRISGVGAIPGTDDEFWLVGNRTTVTGATALLIERFDGDSLSVVPVPGNYSGLRYLVDVDAAGPDFAIAVGRDLIGGTQPVIMMYDGDEWAFETAPPISFAAELSAVKVFTDGTAIAVGIDYSSNIRDVVLERDSSGNWSVFETQFQPNTGAILVDVDAADPPSTLDLRRKNIRALGDHDSLFGKLIYSRRINLDTRFEDFDRPNPLITNIRAQSITSAERGKSHFYAAGIQTVSSTSNSTGGMTVVRIEGVNWTREQDPPVIPGALTKLRLKTAHKPDRNLELFMIWNGIVNDKSRTRMLKYDTLCGGPQATATPTATPTPSSTPTSTYTRTPTSTSTAVPTVTHPPTPTFTGTPTGTTTPTRTGTTAGTATVTPTGTQPSATPTGTGTACTVNFSDVPPGYVFFSPISCLSCRGIVSGYADNRFRPQNAVTRGQMAKFIASAAGYGEAVSGQSFADVPPTNPFWAWYQRLFSRRIVSGYDCGTIPEEPCDEQHRPYARWARESLRGQIAKMISDDLAGRVTPTPTRTALATGTATPTRSSRGGRQRISAQTFEDVPPNHTFFNQIETLAGLGVISGYDCGGPGEPCIAPGNRPYFRPFNNVTRGQTAKIVTNSYFPNDCRPRGK